MSPAGRAPERMRIDLLLVARGLAPTREKAQALILAGRVHADGRRVDKAGTSVGRLADLTVAPGPRFVGRGGEKLDGALDRFGIDPSGIVALDVGASTGGFTDCLLQRGAAQVVALDVGRGQLDWSLRNDPRVVVIEGVNARTMEPTAVGGPFPLIVVDVAFISLRLVLPRLVPLLPPVFAPSRENEGPGAAQGGPRFPAIVALIKPQFEVGKGRVGRGGIVRDPDDQLAAILGVVAAARLEGLGLRQLAASPIRGAEGNREFFAELVPGYDRPERSVLEETRRVVGDSA